MEALMTPLFEQHKKLAAHMAEFGAFLMPIRYSRVIEEHLWVRSKAGLFDVSHMGQIFVRGKNACEFLQTITVNDIAKLKPGQGQYTVLCNESGGMIDDLIIYSLSAGEYLLCVNASNISKDYAWIKNRENLGCEIKNESDFFSQLAVQGPESLGCLLRLGPEFEKVASLAYGEIAPVVFLGQKTWVARTGYTGEKGYEWYLPNVVVKVAWDQLLSDSVGTLKPIGLGARDTLRLEASYLLYGSDMDETISPLEAGIGWAVKLSKGDFVGREALLKQKTEGLKRQMHCFSMLDKSIARAHMSVHDKQGQVIGEVKSASVLPSLAKNGGFFLATRPSTVGEHIWIDIRGQKHEAIIEKRPLYVARIHD